MRRDKLCTLVLPRDGLQRLRKRGKETGREIERREGEREREMESKQGCKRKTEQWGEMQVTHLYLLTILNTSRVVLQRQALVRVPQHDHALLKAYEQLVVVCGAQLQALDHARVGLVAWLDAGGGGGRGEGRERGRERGREGGEGGSDREEDGEGMEKKGGGGEERGEREIAA